MTSEESSWVPPQIVSPEADVRLGQFNGRVMISSAESRALSSAVVAVAAVHGVTHIFKGSTDWKHSGMISVNLYHACKWQSISIDTKIKFDENTGRPERAYFVDTNEVSLSFIDKASIALGAYPTSSAEALSLLTGGVAHRIGFTDGHTEHQVWKFLKDKLLRRCPILVQRLGEDRGDNIPCDCPFPIADLAEVDGTIKLVKLCNPWADLTAVESQLWTGPFSSSDPIWLQRPKVRESLHYSFKAPRGYFWMPLKNLIELYSEVVACSFCPKNVFETLTASAVVDATLTAPISFAAALPVRETLRCFAGAPETLDAPGDPEFLNNPQFRLRMKKMHIPAQVEARLQLSAGNFSPVTMAVFKNRGLRTWKFSESEIIAQVSTKSSIDAALTLTLSKFESETQIYFVLFQEQGVGIANLEKVSLRVLSAHSDHCSLSRVDPPRRWNVHADWGALSHAAGGSSRSGVGWAGNPQVFIDCNYSGRVTLELVVTAQDLPPGNLLGLTVVKARCTLPAVAPPEQQSRTMKRSASKRISELGEVKVVCDPELRELPLNQSDTCLEVSGNSKSSMLLEGLVKDDFPLVVVPWKSNLGPGGSFNLEIFCDHKLNKVVTNTTDLTAISFDSWTSSPGRLDELSPIIPAFSLTVKQACQFRIAVTRNAAQWSQQSARDPLGCMLGLFIFSSEGKVVYSSAFRTGEVLADDVKLEGGNYHLVPTTYAAGKMGVFMISVHSLDDSQRRPLSWELVKRD